jgi:hypothetical protein
LPSKRYYEDGSIFVAGEFFLLFHVLFASSLRIKDSIHFGKGKYINEHLLFQGLSQRHLTLSGSRFALSTQTVTVLVYSILPSPLKEYFHSSVGNLVSFYPITQFVLAPKVAQASNHLSGNTILEFHLEFDKSFNPC